MISSYVTGNYRVWDSNIPKIACAIRTAKHEVTKLNPYFVNLGRKSVLDGKEYEEKVDGIEDVRKRMEKTAERSEQRYNLRRRPFTFVPSQGVWKNNYALSDASKQFSSKLAPKYTGPFYIKKKISPWTYELRDKNSKGVWHAKDLKNTAA